MGFMFKKRNKRHRAESADFEFSAFKDAPFSDTSSTDFDESGEYYEDEYYEDEEYYEDDYSEDGFSEYEDDRDYFDADEDYDSEYNTASFDTASLEVLSHVDYDTASIDYESVRELAGDRDYYDEEEPGQYTEEIGQYTEEIGQFTENLGQYTEEIGQVTEDIGQFTEETGYDTASLDYTGEIDYDSASPDRTSEFDFDTSAFDTRDIEDGLSYDRDYKSDYDYEDSYDSPEENESDYYEDSYDNPQEDSYEDDFDEPAPRKKSEKLEEDEYVDLDKSYDRDYDKPRKKGNIIKIAVIAAAVLLLAAVGVFALKDRIFKNNSTADVEYITTPGGVTLPYSEQMIGSGSEIIGIEMIGQGGLNSALDARKTQIADAAPSPSPSESHDYGESDIITRTSVSIELITVKSDLKIRFINNETGKLIPNVAFKVTVTDPSGKSLSWSDDDKDGIIYKSSISEGKYTVHVERIEGDSYQGYTWPSDKSVTVKSTIEYAVVDVQGEVKEANQVNENAEDTASRGNTDQQDMTDTTENVASSESTDYTEIAKDTIADPGVTDVSGEGSSADPNAQLKDKSGNEVYVLDNNAYRKATNADYSKFDKFYIVSGTRYTGWQTIGGATYYYDKDGKPVTGTQVIGGVTYQFAADGKLTSASGVLGIDVSKWNGVIDWNAVKAAGVEFVIIRVGYRGSSAGALIDDAMFATNIQGAKAAGLKVGVYFVTQAINDVEAVYEASMVLDRIKGYSLDMPVFLDVEASGGRGDMIDKATRTAVITAFCETIRSAGYTAGIYANKTWLGTKMDTSAFGNYVIWVAHYSSVCGYTGRYTCWQYTDKGTLPGINGSVDLNLWYS